MNAPVEMATNEQINEETLRPATKEKDDKLKNAYKPLPVLKRVRNKTLQKEDFSKKFNLESV